MKYKKTVTVTVTLLLAVFFAVRAFASSGDIDSYMQGFSTDELLGGISDEAAALLREAGITELSADAMFSVSAAKIFDVLFGLFGEKLPTVLSYALSVSGVCILSGTLGLTGRRESLINICASSVCALISAPGILSVVSECFSVLEALSAFSVGFAGVFCAALSAAGGTAAAASFAALHVFYESGVSFLCSAAAQPFADSLCSLAFLSALDIRTVSQKTAQFIKKTYILLLGFAGAVFTGIFSIKNLMAQSTDGLAFRGVKFIVGKSVPIVGGALSENFESVIASLALIKNTVGVFGIITVALTVAPTVISVLMWLIALNGTSLISDLLGCEKITSVLSVFSDALSLLLATVIFSACVFTVCVGVVISFGGGVH